MGEIQSTFILKTLSHHSAHFITPTRHLGPPLGMEVHWLAPCSVPLSAALTTYMPSTCSVAFIFFPAWLHQSVNNKSSLGLWPRCWWVPSPTSSPGLSSLHCLAGAAWRRALLQNPMDCSWHPLMCTAPGRDLSTPRCQKATEQRKECLVSSREKA